MNEVKDKVWFLREGLFAKYVVALVGLVVFVLAVNGAMEIWITYGGIKRSLADGMSEKAEATAKRIEQSMADLERQINWVTRASSTKTEERRADYAQLLRQVPQVSQLSLLNAQGREQLRHTRQTVTLDSNADFSRDVRFIETVRRGTSFAPAYLRDQRPFMSISLPHVAMAASPSPRSTWLPRGLLRRRAGRQGGLCLCHRSQGRGAGEFGEGAGGRQESFRAAAGRRRHSDRRQGADIRHGYPRRCGADDGGHGAKARLARVLRTADRAGVDADPRPIGADRASDRARPRGRDHRRHHHGPPHAGADHRAAGRRAGVSAPAISATASR